VIARRAFAATLLAVVAAAACPAGGGANLTVKSAASLAGGRIPLRYAAKLCGGRNVSVPLEWRGLPALTRSVAVTMFDPDAREGAGFWHWVVYDIPASASHLDASVDGARLPAGSVVGRNDAQTNAYFGPCPPKGELHHYRVTVYALGSSFVQSMPDRGAAAIVNRFTPSILARGTLVGTYQR
jgi:Raf kinase inhibitor-like YbhB/YbcL family protein